jgi:hypothetical protein
VAEGLRAGFHQSYSALPHGRRRYSDARLVSGDKSMAKYDVVAESCGRLSSVYTHRVAMFSMELEA